uniref:glutamate synthase (ferredoxin) n=1 Tax=Hirondellea gigas TaxID=1518452 RepID=A0A6A7GC43_9CRUS
MPVLFAQARKQKVISDRNEFVLNTEASTCRMAQARIARVSELSPAPVHTPFSKTFPKKQGLYDPQHEKDACGVGFIADLSKTPSHLNLVDALTLLERLSHRGAIGSDSRTGDGAGVLTDIPHEFFVSVLGREFPNVKLPEKGQYGLGTLFLPKDRMHRNESKRVVEDIVRSRECTILCWRDVPTVSKGIGKEALATEPKIEQVFIQPNASNLSESDFDLTLYVIRKQITHKFHDEMFADSPLSYVCSLSSRVVVYKGQLSSPQLRDYFLDLCDERFSVQMAMVHSRFSTNTFPSWERAHPFRTLGRNEEINTLRGNVNWMRDREGVMLSDTVNLKELHPVIGAGTSDSGAFDNALEFLSYTGGSNAALKVSEERGTSTRLVTRD